MEEKEIIKNFNIYLEEYGIKQNEITFEDVNDYMQSIHFDIVNEAENFGDIEIIENEIEKIIYENFKIIIND